MESVHSSFLLTLRDREQVWERNMGLSCLSSLHSLAASCVCPARGSNRQPWCIRTTLWPTRSNQLSHPARARVCLVLSGPDCCDHHHNQDTELFCHHNSFPLAVPLRSHLFPTSPPSLTLATTNHCNFLILRMLRKRIHTYVTFETDFFFPLNSVLLRPIQVVLCFNSLFLYTAT